MTFCVEEGQVFCLKSHILFALLDEEGVALDLESRVSHEINRTGAGILKELNGKRDVKELVRTLAETCEEPEELLLKDVVGFLTDLYERGWLYVEGK